MEPGDFIIDLKAKKEEFAARGHQIAALPEAEKTQRDNQAIKWCEKNEATLKVLEEGTVVLMNPVDFGRSGQPLDESGSCEWK